MLKVMKGARVLVDCESEELYMDLGDGQCRPLGGGSGGGASDVCNVLIAQDTSGGEAGTVYTCNRKHQEIDTAWQNGLPVVAF